MRQGIPALRFAAPLVVTLVLPASIPAQTFSLAPGSPMVPAPGRPPSGGQP